MKIAEIQLFLIRIPFKEPFRHTLATRRFAENVVVKIKTDEGVEGFGEAVPRDYVTGETPETVFRDTHQIFAPTLWELKWNRPEEVQTFLKNWGSFIQEKAGWNEEKSPAARCALELALLDAAGHTFSCSAVELLGWQTHPQPLYYSGVISGEKVSKAARKAWLMRLYGFRAVKLKVGGPDDTFKIQKVRKKLGPRVDLRLDANGAWPAATAIQKINSWIPYGISAVEQPVPKEDLEGMKQVTAGVETDIVADESLSSLRDALQLSEQKGCDIFNIRLSKCGGLFHAGEIFSLAEKRGLQSQLGCQVGETAILSSAGRLFAQTHPGLRYLEGSYERFLLQEDLSKKRVRFGYGGKAEPVSGNGLGVEIRPDVLDRLTQTYLLLKRP